MCRTQAPPNLWHMALLLPLYLWMTPTLAADHVSAGDVRSAVAATPSGTLDLSGKDMSGDDLTDLDLSGANLTEANLSGAKLHGVKLVGANLTGADHPSGSDLRLDHPREFHARSPAQCDDADSCDLDRDG
jgi:uncharacterized protein YjbI with pentapeptide repeats